MDGAVDEVRSELERLELDKTLIVEDGFRRRAEALDIIELDILERIGGMPHAGEALEEPQALWRRANALKSRLEAANEDLFAKLRSRIRSGNLKDEELRRRLLQYAGIESDGTDDVHLTETGYDGLDALVSGLLLIWPPPEETRSREPEMVYYQPTPARIVFDLVAQAHLSAQDIFYDIGSGLGQVVILAHLLSGVKALGVERDPAYCAYARRCAAELGLSQVEFLNADAREASLSDGTVFFLYTPFTGKLLQDVLNTLESVSQTREICLFTYGPCTSEVAGQSWLRCEATQAPAIDGLAAFHSRRW